MKLKKFLITVAILIAGTTTTNADALSATPKRVGPVQNYGALGTNGNKIVSLVNGNQVMLRGMSLYWSDATGSPYYNDNVITWATENLGIDVFRFAMGIQYYNSNGSATNPLEANFSYIGDPSGSLAKLDRMVESAIKNDVYIIIDWHSHRADQEIDQANTFFAEVSKKYANVPNVIFEIFNEPVHQSWDVVKSYANTVSSTIRQNSNNLILVGTPNWSQLTSYGGVNAKNVGYVFHFYAGEHSLSSFGSKVTGALNAGVPIFITEWGTTKADGKTWSSNSESESANWINFMETNKISNCNWSLRQVKTSGADDENTALFDGEANLITRTALENATYSTSGTIVKNYLQKYKTDWAKSLVAGKTGTCSFTNQSVKETAGSIANVLKSGCSYTSSNPSVAEANGSSIVVKSAGFAIFTATDGSQSVVSVKEEAAQTISGFEDKECRYLGTCTGKKGVDEIDGTGKMQSILSVSNKTDQGSTVTYTALNPDIINVEYVTCQTTSRGICGGVQNAKVYVLTFNQYGEGKIVATAPAVSGAKAMNDTITVVYKKGQNRIHSKFKDQTIALGGTVDMLPDTAMSEKAKVTYTYNGVLTSPYLTQQGSIIIGGNTNAIISIKATTEETANYEPFAKTVTLVIGDKSLATNQEEFEEAHNQNPITIASNFAIPFRAELQNAGILLHIGKAGNVEWNIYTPNGKTLLQKKATYSQGSHWISTEDIPSGNYLIRVRQGSQTKTFHFNKQ